MIVTWQINLVLHVFALQLYFIQRDIGENVCMKAFGIKVFMSQESGLNV